MGLGTSWYLDMCNGFIVWFGGCTGITSFSGLDGSLYMVVALIHTP